MKRLLFMLSVLALLIYVAIFALDPGGGSMGNAADNQKPDLAEFVGAAQ